MKHPHFLFNYGDFDYGWMKIPGVFVSSILVLVLAKSLYSMSTDDYVYERTVTGHIVECAGMETSYEIRARGKQHWCRVKLPAGEIIRIRILTVSKNIEKDDWVEVGLYKSDAKQEYRFLKLGKTH